MDFDQATAEISGHTGISSVNFQLRNGQQNGHHELEFFPSSMRGKKLLPELPDREQPPQKVEQGDLIVYLTFGKVKAVGPLPDIVGWTGENCVSA